MVMDEEGGGEASRMNEGTAEDDWTNVLCAERQREHRGNLTPRFLAFARRTLLCG